MRTSEAGILLIERFEGFVPYRYDDGTGVQTIGFGTTNADVSPLPTYVTRAQAEQLLRSGLARSYEPAVNRLGIPLNQHQYDALVSLAYNCGPGVFAWQIGRDLRARNYAAAAADFGNYVYAGGRVLQGLVNRRAAERALFLSPMPTPPDPHHYELFAPGPERDTVEAWDHLKSWQITKRRALYNELVKLRKAVWTAAHASHPPAWGVRNRGWRWQELNRRTSTDR